MIHSITALGRCSDSFTFSPVVFFYPFSFFLAPIYTPGVLYEAR
jgi:hypothetical protein